jgi:hypothetical protein
MYGLFGQGCMTLATPCDMFDSPRPAARLKESCLARRAHINGGTQPVPHDFHKGTESGLTASKTGEPGEWVTVTSRHQPSTEADAVVSSLETGCAMCPVGFCSDPACEHHELARPRG